MAEGLVDREHLIGFQEIFVNPNDPNLRSITALNKDQEQELRRQSVQADYILSEQEIARVYIVFHV